MCGIVGALCFKNSSGIVSEPHLKRMRDMMKHRGPDDAGVWVSDDKTIGLGHRRLSIIDLSDSAAQPMSNYDKTLWITFNGEIYNHAEIRKELEGSEDYIWKTNHSDTEVILHSFEHWGIDCIQRFRGMFAIGIWDVRKRELWLVRDRIGIKPLYYSVHGGRLTFASEIKALLADNSQKREVNEEAFYHYLSFLTTPAPQTLFDGIMKLSPGTWLRVSEDGHVLERRYWDVWAHTEPLTDCSDEEIAEKVKNELRTSVRMRKIGDVPVGVFLSGGIDSSSNAALFSEGENTPIKTFSIGYKGDYKSYQNETSYARKMASLVNAEYHEKLLDVDDLIDFLPQMIYLQDEPIADPVCVPVYYVAKLARDNGVTVCQVGEGADELFCGYPGWRTSLHLQSLCERYSYPSVFRLLTCFGSHLPKIKSNFRLEWLRRASMGQPIFWGGAEGFSEIEKSNLLSERLRKRFRNFSSWEALEPFYLRFRQGAWEKTHLNWMSYLDLNFRLPELLLMRIDKMCMGVSLEGRVPFLDHKFVELAMSIPESVKIKNDQLKYILKKAVQGIIPEEIINRKKMGFSVPIQEWFLGKLGKEAEKILGRFVEETDLLDKKAVTRLIKEDRGAQLWYLVNFAKWHEQWIA